ncbi:nuclear factor of activated T-cells, cytoplasmic 1-like [Ictidomys tridecemlineatus]
MTRLEPDPEFDFEFLFEFDQGGEAATEHYGFAPSSSGSALPLPAAHTSLAAPCQDLQTATPGISAVPTAGHPSGYGGAVDSGPAGYFLSSGHARPNGAPALESPRIEITSYLGLQHGSGQFFHDVEVEDVLPSCKRSPSTATLTLPSLEAYRDPSCLSPASSLSSRSCNSEASSYESNYSYPYASPQTSPWQSPCVSPKTTDPEEGFPRGLGACHLLGSPRHSPSTSPRTSITEESWLGARNSRPTSPCNKRKYSLNGRQPSCSPHHSPTPSPHGSPRVSVTEDTWLGNSTQYTSSAIVAAINALTTDSLDLGEGVPVKSRKTTLEHAPSVVLKAEPTGEELGVTPPTSDLPPEEFTFQPLRKGPFCEQYLSVPQPPYQWAKPKSLTPATYVRRRLCSLAGGNRELECVPSSGLESLFFLFNGYGLPGAHLASPELLLLTDSFPTDQAGPGEQGCLHPAPSTGEGSTSVSFRSQEGFREARSAGSEGQSQVHLCSSKTIHPNHQDDVGADLESRGNAFVTYVISTQEARRFPEPRGRRWAVAVVMTLAQEAQAASSIPRADTFPVVQEAQQQAIEDEAPEGALVLGSVTLASESADSQSLGMAGSAFP